MLKIALISESPSVATGFGVNCRHLVQLLASLQHEVVCFGVCALGQPLDPAQYSCRIVPMPRDQRDALELLPAFLHDEQPDLLFVHYDLAAVSRFIVAARAAGWHGPIITHFVIDGIPFGEEYLAVLHTVAASITPTHSAAKYVQSCGIAHVLVAPHPVDPAVFQPLPHRALLRRGAGLDDRFVVGVFGRNVERKQQPRVMLALQSLKQCGRADEIVLYFHCQPNGEDPWLNSWDLRQVARQLDITDQVLLLDPAFSQLAGIPYAAHATYTSETRSAQRTPAIPTAYGYVERMNCCDLIVNVPYSGAFELVALESQLCGVPVAITNDHGAMAEVVGDSALLLEPIDIGIQSSGGRQAFVSHHTIAEAILTVQHDAELRTTLIARGQSNAARYTLESLRDAVAQSLAMAALTPVAR